MMRQNYRTRTSLAEMEKPTAFAAGTISCKGKENDHIAGAVAGIEMETSHSSKVQGTEKSTSNSLFWNLNNE